MAKKCKAGLVRFKTKRGKTVSFKGHVGSDCGPRPKPSTRHLAPYKAAMRRAAKGCKGRHGQAFRNCISTEMPR